MTCTMTEWVTGMFAWAPQARLAQVEAAEQVQMAFQDELPSRQAQLSTLKNTDEFDVLVVGGGATGSGCALDAVTRSKSLSVIKTTLNKTSLYIIPFLVSKYSG